MPLPLHLPFEHVGRVPLSASRRLTVTLRSETGHAEPFIDLRLQVHADGRWQQTKQGVTIESDRLPELMATLERAIEKLPSL